MKIKLKITFIGILFFWASQHAMAQIIYQNVRGTVLDKISQSPLPGAVIQVVNIGPTLATASDGEGNFVLSKVPVGKQNITISLLGYKQVSLQNVNVNSGKELVLTINLEEDTRQMEEVVVVAKTDKNKALNDMSVVSARTFSVEETQKFAAAANDPGRMVTSFPGVVGGNDGNNIISIRGNSPNGLLWRMEGVEIPNPNHFSNVGSSGGGISILSSQLLSNSDFSTGAFAAEYGNALSGVFDLKLRKGNNQRKEYTVQLGVLGADVAAEGPFKKGYGGSYLINYRYSTLSLLGKIGVPLGDAITNFQDVSFNISLPTKNYGTFGLFGFGGLSDQSIVAKKDSLKWKEDDFVRTTARFYANTGAVGLTHVKLFSNQSYLKTAVVYSGTGNGYNEKRMNTDYVTFQDRMRQNFYQTKTTLSTTYTKKINSKSNIRSGVILNRLTYNLSLKDVGDTTVLIERINQKGETYTAQAFFQWNYKLAPKLTTNIGLHYLQLFFNNSYAADPRLSLKYEATKSYNFSFGYGLHSQLQPIGVYFAKDMDNMGNIIQPNKNLGLSRAHHFVLGFDYLINDFSHLKTEAYYQHLFNIPVSSDKTSTYSILNAIDGYTTNPLENTGLGRNCGVEITYERFLHKNLYYLLTCSLYESKYKAPNGEWYNTLFNTNYAFTLTAGKEWVLARSEKNRTIGFNIKTLYIGGLRYTSIDLPASIAAGQQKEVTYTAFDNKVPDYFRFDWRFSLKRNFQKITTTFSIDIQNTTNHRNVGGQYFDRYTGKVKYWYQTPLIPLLNYKIEF